MHSDKFAKAKMLDGAVDWVRAKWTPYIASSSCDALLTEQGRRMAASSGDSRQRMQRKRWNDETAKRIHVAVRVRPMNINEIKADAKVEELCHV